MQDRLLILLRLSGLLGYGFSSVGQEYQIQTQDPPFVFGLFPSSPAKLQLAF